MHPDVGDLDRALKDASCFDLEPPIYRFLARLVNVALEAALERNILTLSDVSRRLERLRYNFQTWHSWNRVQIVVNHLVIQRSLWSLLDDISAPRPEYEEGDDLRYIGEFVTSLVDNDEDNRRLVQLQDQEAQVVLDLLLTLVDVLPSGSTARRRVKRALRRLSENSGQLPQCLFLEDVSCKEKDFYEGGGFADVWRGMHNGKPVAIKRLRILGPKEEREKTFKALLREALIWRQLAHPSILNFWGVSRTVFEYHHSLISPWMDNGTINEYLLANTDANRPQMLIQIGEGMCYLHELEPQVVHGDLRGANVLVNEYGNPQICDFGLARIRDSHSSTAGAVTSCVKGATRWMAPEVFNEFGSLTACSDVYAFGCLCLEVFTGAAPFANVREHAIPLLVFNGRKPADELPLQALERGLNSTFWKFMQECWKFDPDERPTMRTLVATMKNGADESRHPYYSDQVHRRLDTLLSSYIEYPDQRPQVRNYAVDSGPSPNYRADSLLQPEKASACDVSVRLSPLVGPHNAPDISHPLRHSSPSSIPYPLTPSSRTDLHTTPPPPYPPASRHVGTLDFTLSPQAILHAKAVTWTADLKDLDQTPVPAVVADLDYSRFRRGQSLLRQYFGPPRSTRITPSPLPLGTIQRQTSWGSENDADLDEYGGSVEYSCSPWTPLCSPYSKDSTAAVEADSTLSHSESGSDETVYGVPTQVEYDDLAKPTDNALLGEECDKDKNRLRGVDTKTLAREAKRPSLKIRIPNPPRSMYERVDPDPCTLAEGGFGGTSSVAVAHSILPSSIRLPKRKKPNRVVTTERKKSIDPTLRMETRSSTVPRRRSPKLRGSKVTPSQGGGSSIPEPSG